MANDQTTSLGELLARLFWMLIGPLTLVMLAFGIVRVGQGWLTAVDVGYLAVLGVMILARWFEFHKGHPRTAEGKPATAAHLRRYAIGALTLGLAVWVLANLLGNYVLST